MIARFSSKPYYKCVDIYFETTETAFTNFIKNERIRQLLASKEHFDLVMTEVFAGQEFSLILGKIFNAPVIGLQPYITNSVANSILGNTLSLPYIPDICAPFGNNMSFLERLINSAAIIRGLFYVYRQQYLPRAEATMRRHFPDAPPLLEMLNTNLSLMFINDHLTADYARPRTPNIVPVAGIHVEDKKPLPKVKTDFLQNNISRIF